MLENAYGHFTDDGRTFTITDAGTPAPWVNVISNGRYGFVVSHNGGGFSWLDNSQLNVLTRWEMDVIADRQGRFVYLSDRDAGDVWSLAPSPCRASVNDYRCHHTLGSTTFEGERGGIRWSWTLAVAPDDPVEVWIIRITNESKRDRRVRIASYFEWCCGVAPDSKREFHKLFFTTSFDASRHAIYSTKNMWDLPPKHERDKWNLPWPYAAAHAVHCDRFEQTIATADKAAFLGRAGDAVRPAGMIDGNGPARRFGRFSDASAALGGDLTLAPGESVTLHYTLAAERGSAEQLGPIIDRYRSIDAAERAVASAEQFWADRTDAPRIESDEDAFDLLNNHWLPYQAISGRLWARCGYYQQSGAFGFRDQLQDSQVWLPYEHQRTRDQILLHAAHQFADGSVYHWWHPLSESGLVTTCSDDYLWLPFITASYLRETGDFDILKAEAPFLDPDVEASAPLLEHCRRAIARAFSRMSTRGLPLIGACDWNDGLSAVGLEEKGESVWLGFFLSQILKDFAHIMDHLGDAASAEACLAKRIDLVDALNTHAWDGAWFRRATQDSGEWLGTRDNLEGRIYLNPQTWSILTESTDDDRAEQAWQSVKDHLLKEMGPLLLAPAYTVPDEHIGYITRYAPGARENGGVYMHAATWALAAACKRRDQQAVEQIWRSIAPPLRGQDADGYVAEPYVTPGNVDGPLSETPGRAGWTWYTGSAAWLNRVCMEWVLGVRPEWGGLRIDPCPLRSLSTVRFTRAWRGRTLQIRFDASAYAPDASPVLTVNGSPHKGTLLREVDLPPESEIEIEVAWVAIETKGTVPGRQIEGAQA